MLYNAVRKCKACCGCRAGYAFLLRLTVKPQSLVLPILVQGSLEVATTFVPGKTELFSCALLLDCEGYE